MIPPFSIGTRVILLSIKPFSRLMGRQRQIRLMLNELAFLMMGIVFLQNDKCIDRGKP